jgi:hypothetical protein
VRVLLRRASSCHIFGHHCSHHIVTQLVVHWAGHETRINLPSHSQSTLLPVSRPVSGIRTLTVRKRSPDPTAFRDRSERSRPAPQKRGTGGTLRIVWKAHRDRGHLSSAANSRTLPQ